MVLPSFGAGHQTINKYLENNMISNLVHEIKVTCDFYSTQLKCSFHIAFCWHFHSIPHSRSLVLNVRCTCKLIFELCGLIGQCLNSFFKNYAPLAIFCHREQKPSSKCALNLEMWPDLRKPGILSKRAYGAMRVYSTSGQKLSKFSFCHIYVKEPFY